MAESVPPPQNITGNQARFKIGRILQITSLERPGLPRSDVAVRIESKQQDEKTRGFYFDNDESIIFISGPSSINDTELVTEPECKSLINTKFLPGEEDFFEIAEAVFVGWFTFEYVIRFIAAPYKIR